MERSLSREKKLQRLTALRGLQMEEQDDPFKILIGTILSARTRDENTTKVVKKLFARFKTPDDIASADIDEIKKSNPQHRLLQCQSRANQAGFTDNSKQISR